MLEPEYGYNVDVATYDYNSDEYPHNYDFVVDIHPIKNTYKMRALKASTVLKFCQICGNIHMYYTFIIAVNGIGLIIAAGHLLYY